MIAKLICWDKDRSSAVMRMKRALSEYNIAGVVTNMDFLNHILSENRFINGDYDINFIDSMDMKENDIFQKKNNDIDNAAALIAALMKHKKSRSIIKNKQNSSSNWWGLNYE